MPNYQTHDRIAYITTPVIAAATYIGSDNATVAGVVAISFLIANHWLSPDLDIDSIMNHRWGWLYIIWFPYKKVLHHRSVWTHSGPLSATIRLLYLLMWILRVVFIFDINIPLFIPTFLYIGMILADSLHSLLDWLL